MERDWLEILREASPKWVNCFNGIQERATDCIRHDGNYIHKDDVEEYLRDFIGMDAEELTKLKTELYAKLQEL